jgi:hypothetical protein
MTLHEPGGRTPAMVKEGWFQGKGRRKVSGTFEPRDFPTCKE